MTRIIIRNIAQLKAFTQKLRAVAATIPTLQVQALERAADDAVLTDIHRDMETNQFSKKIIDKTFVGPINLLNNGKKAQIHFISDFVSDSGFDVSEGREEGTQDHDVFAKPGGVLSYIDQSTGKRVFFKHTRPSGIERLLIIETNIAKNKQSFRDSYVTQIVCLLNQMVSMDWQSIRSMKLT